MHKHNNMHVHMHKHNMQMYTCTSTTTSDPPRARSARGGSLVFIQQHIRIYIFFNAGKGDANREVRSEEGKKK